MKLTRIVIAISIICFFVIPSRQLFGMGGKLLAGTSKVSITPTTEPVHDSIYARTLILQLDGQRIAFVSVDLPGMSDDKVKQVCKDKYGIDHLMICASHNHSAPFRFSKTDYTALYEERVLKSVELASKNLFEATISGGRKSFPQLGFIRLIPREDGHTRESWMPDEQHSYLNRERIPYGPVDNEVGVIKVSDMNGNPRVIVMNYACHADLVCDNYEISADYPGAATTRVEQAFDNKVNCLFVNGAAGNVAPLFTVPRRTGPDDALKTDYTQMDKMGELLARETVKVANSLGTGSKETSIRIMEDKMNFTGRFDKTLDFEVHIASLLINNDIAIAVSPGELFTQLAIDWKKKMQEEVANPMFFGYTWTEGKSPGYVADVKGAAQGGYGADQDTRIIQVGAGEALMNRQYENYFKLSGFMRDKPGPSGFKRGDRWFITLTK
jgi:neutral ceramidase